MWGGDVRQEEVGDLARRLAKAEDNGLVLGRRVEYLAGELLEVPPTPELWKGSPTVNSPAMQWFSKVEIAFKGAFE